MLELHQSAEYNDDGPESVALRGRRQKPKQEPLAYAFRSQGGTTTTSEGNNKKNGHTESLGSGYAIVQMHPPPPPPQQRQQHYQHQAPHVHKMKSNHYKNMDARPKSSDGYNKPAQQQYQAQQQHQARQQHNYGTRNMRPTFGMPAMRAPPAPRPHIMRQHPRQQAMYRMASSPAVTFDQLMLMQYMQQPEGWDNAT